MAELTDAIEAARHAVGLNLHDATRAINAAEAIIRADERAKVSEEIAKAIEVKQGRRCPECQGKAGSSKPNGYFVDKRCGGGHTWTHHEHWHAHDWAAIARQHAGNDPRIAVERRTAPPGGSAKGDGSDGRSGVQEGER